MKWPRVPRSALEAVEAERDRLLERVERLEDRIADLTDHLGRLARVEHGLGEHRTEKKPDPEPMPEEVEAQIKRWNNPAIRQKLTEDSWRLYRQTGSWDRVLPYIQPGREL